MPRLNIKDICSKCKKRKTCKVLCYPIAEYLKRENRGVYEDRRSKDRIVLHNNRRCLNVTSLQGEHPKDGTASTGNAIREAFSTENASAFAAVEVNHVQTSVFLKRFFAKMEWGDIAQIHDIPEKIARNHYRNAMTRFLQIIMELDKLKPNDPLTMDRPGLRKREPSPEELEAREKKRKQANVKSQKRYHEKNRERIKAKRRERYRKNKAAMIAANKRNLAKRLAAMTPEELEAYKARRRETARKAQRKYAAKIKAQQGTP